MLSKGEASLAGSDTLEERVVRMESELTALRAEAAVYRAALVWLMGVHQLSDDDQNPRRAVLEPLGMDPDYNNANPERPVDPNFRTVSRDFIEAAYRVFLSRKLAVS